MTVVKVFIAYDDLRHSQGLAVIATRTETLSFAGEQVTLDLTDETVLEIRQQLAELFKLGTPGKPEQPGKKLPRGRGSANYPYLLGLRKWAESNGEPIRKGVNGKYYYSVGLKQRYNEHLKEQQKQS